MKRFLTTLLALLDDLMRQATWTHEVGVETWGQRDGTVRIALPALDVAPWNCHTWNVALILPLGVTMATTGANTAQSHTGLATGATIDFDVVFDRTDMVNNEIRRSRGWLQIQVKNPIEDAHMVRHSASGSPYFLYPITFYHEI